MTSDPVVRLRTALRRIDQELESGRLAAIPALEAELCAAREAAQDQAIGAEPEILGQIAVELEAQLNRVRRVFTRAEHDTSRRLHNLLAATWVHQTSVRADGAEFRERRGDAIGALLLDPEDPARLRMMFEAVSKLERAVESNYSPYSAEPHALAFWVQRANTFLARSGSRLDSDRASDLKTKAEESAILFGREIPEQTLREAVVELSELALLAEAEDLSARLADHLAAEADRIRAVEFLRDPDIRPDERALLDGEVSRLGDLDRDEAPSENDLEKRIAGVAAVLEARRESARERLARTLVRGRQGGLEDDVLSPANHPELAGLEGVQLYRAGAARIELLLDERSNTELESRLARAVERASLCLRAEGERPEASDLRTALAQLKICAAAEAPVAVAALLERLEALLPDGDLAETDGEPYELSETGRRLLQTFHPLAAKTWARLEEWVAKWGDGDAAELLQQIAAEAKALQGGSDAFKL